MSYKQGRHKRLSLTFHQISFIVRRRATNTKYTIARRHLSITRDIHNKSPQMSDPYKYFQISYAKETMDYIFHNLWEDSSVSKKFREQIYQNTMNNICLIIKNITHPRFWSMLQILLTFKSEKKLSNTKYPPHRCILLYTIRIFSINFCYIYIKGIFNWSLWIEYYFIKIY